MSYAQLVVDSVEPNDQNTMYLSPSKLYCTQFFSPNVFDRATIRNCSIDQITSGGLVGVFTSLKPLAKIQITVFQPISVMLDYDTNQIESNLKLVGFENIRIIDTNFKDEESGLRIPSKSIEAQKPKGKKNVNIGYEVTKTSYKEKTKPYKKEFKYESNNTGNNQNSYEVSKGYKSYKFKKGFK